MSRVGDKLSPGLLLGLLLLLATVMSVAVAQQRDEVTRLQAQLHYADEVISQGPPPCPEEDSVGPCVWNAQEVGNGQGTSFYSDAQGRVYYLDGAGK